MRKKLFSEFAKRLYGPSGRYWSELGALTEVWRYSFMDQYPDGEHPAEKSVQRYCAGTSRFPSRLRKRYTQRDGLDVLIQNMKRVVGSSGSMSQVLRIQQGVHAWLENADVDQIEVDELNRYFVPDEASREEIAAYLAYVMHKIIAVS